MSRHKASQSKGLASREEVTTQFYFSQLFFYEITIISDEGDRESLGKMT